MRRSLAFALLMPLPLFGCAAQVRGGAPAYHLLFEDLEAGIVAEPLTLGPRAIGHNGEPVLAAHWTGRSPLLRRVGLFNGLEGAPVLDAHGELCGMLAGGGPYLPRFGDGSSPWVPVLGRADIEADLQRSRLLRSSTETCQPLPGDLGDIQPGSAIALVRWFGSLDDSEPGTIGWREGSEVYCAAGDGRPDRRAPGPCMLALARPEIVDFAYTGVPSGWTRVDSLGEIVGTAVYEGAYGTYAVLGVSPPLIAVAIDVRLDGEVVQANACSLVGDPRLWQDWLAHILSAVLSRHFGRGGGTARLLVQADDDDAVQIEVTVTHGLTAAQEALAHLGPNVPSAVHITLSLR